MEREEEKMQAALDYANNLDDLPVNDGFSKTLAIALGQSFIKGIDWADSHPRKGLVDIEEVCKFIKENANDYIEIIDGQLRFKKTLVSDLRKVIEK